MIDHAGASFSFSLLIVVLAAVILHRVEANGEASPVAKAAGGVKGELATSPPPKPPGVDPRPEAKSPPQPAPDGPVRKPDVATRRDPFTRAEAGETLADVAHRVYGPDADVRAIWALNRDQVADMAVPLERGLLLRTPEL